MQIIIKHRVTNKYLAPATWKCAAPWTDDWMDAYVFEDEDERAELVAQRVGGKTVVIEE